MQRLLLCKANGRGKVPCIIERAGHRAPLSEGKKTPFSPLASSTSPSLWYSSITGCGLCCAQSAADQRDDRPRDERPKMHKPSGGCLAPRVLPQASSSCRQPAFLLDARHRHQLRRPARWHGKSLCASIRTAVWNQTVRNRSMDHKLPASLNHESAEDGFRRSSRMKELETKRTDMIVGRVRV